MIQTHPIHFSRRPKFQRQRLRVQSTSVFLRKELVQLILTNSKKVCLNINNEQICSDSYNGFEITDDIIKFTGLQDGVSKIQMIVDNENESILMNNLMIIYAG